MATDHPDKIAESDSPTRCQYSDKVQQCPYEQVTGTRYCNMHKHQGWGVAQDRKKMLRRYRLTQHYARFEELAGDAECKDMREELAIQRMIVEEVVNSCKTPFDMVCNSQRISDLIIKVQKSVQMMHKMEMALGQVLDKATLLSFTDQIIKIVAEEIQDEAVIKRVGEKMALAIEKVSNPLEKLNENNG